MDFDEGRAFLRYVRRSWPWLHQGPARPCLAQGRNPHSCDAAQWRLVGGRDAYRQGVERGLAASPQSAFAFFRSFVNRWPQARPSSEAVRVEHVDKTCTLMGEDAEEVGDQPGVTSRREKRSYLVVTRAEPRHTGLARADGWRVRYMPGCLRKARGCLENIDVGRGP
jgi:hypothetical protein